MKFFNFKKINFYKSLNLSRFKNATVIIVTLAMFIGINLLLSFVSLRLDFSQGRRYSLSNSTKKILGNLKDNLKIDFYASSNIPTRLVPLRQEVVDLIKEYANASGKINFSLVSDQNAAKNGGLPVLQFSEVQNNQYALSNAYFGIVLTYGNNKAAIPQVTDVESLEYNLTSAVYKMTKTNLPTVSIFGKEENADPATDDLASFKNLLSKQFTLSFDTKVNDKSSAIIVFDNNTKQFTEEEVSTLEQYLKKGGKILFFVDGTWVADSLSTSPAKHNLFNLLKNYGITLNQDLVLSADSEMVNFGNGSVNFLVPYPFWVKTNNFNGKYSYFQNINSLTFPWTSSLKIENQNGVDAQPLIYTTKNSWTQNGNFILDPQSIPQPSMNQLSEKTLGALVKIKGGGEFMIIPSSRFTLEKYQGGASQNLDFVNGVLDDFASGGALSGITAHAVSIYQLPNIADSEKEIFKYANILLLPLLFAIYGAVRIVADSKEENGHII